MQANTKLPQNRTSIAQKKKKYFNQSYYTHEQPDIHNNNVSHHPLDIMTINTNRQSSPKPDFNNHMSIQATNYPHLNINTRQNLNKKQQKLSQNTYSLEKSKQKSKDQYYKAKHIKIQDDLNSSVEKDNKKVQRKKQIFTSNLTQQQQKLNQLKRYMQKNTRQQKQKQYTTQKLFNQPSIKTNYTSQKLKEYKNQSSTEKYKSNNDQQTYFTMKKRLKQEYKIQFSSNTTGYNKLLQSYKNVIKTSQQLMAQNIQLKQINNHIKNMHREALKTICNLQKIIQDQQYQNSYQASSQYYRYTKIDFKDIYHKLYPYQHINKIIKPNLQQQLILYAQNQNKIKTDLQQDTKKLEEELQQVRDREADYKKINQFIKKQNTNLNYQIKMLKASKQKYTEPGLQTIILPKSRTQVFDIKTIKKIQIQNKNQLHIQNQDFKKQQKKQQSFLQKNQQKQIKLPQFKFQSPKINNYTVLTSTNQKNQQQISIIQKQLQQKLIFITQQFNAKIKELQFRCMKLEQYIQNIRHENRLKNKQIYKNQAYNPKLSAIGGDIDSINSTSQIMQQSALSAIKNIKDNKKQYKQRQNIQNEFQIRSNQQIMQILKQKVKYLQNKVQMFDKIDGKKTKNQKKMSKKTNILNKVQNIRNTIQNCNFQNFQHLYNQFGQILEEKKHLMFRLLQIQEYKDKKHAKIWQLQQELIQLRKNKNQLIQKCIALQNYIQKNLPTNKTLKTNPFLQIMNRIYAQKANQKYIKCQCELHLPIDVNGTIIYKESQGLEALQWIKNIQKILKHCINLISQLEEVIQSD